MFWPYIRSTEEEEGEENVPRGPALKIRSVGGGVLGCHGDRGGDSVHEEEDEEYLFIWRKRWAVASPSLQNGRSIQFVGGLEGGT